MGKYNYLIFGLGRQGKAVLDDLLKNCEAQHIGIVDPDPNQMATLNHPVSIPITFATTAENFLKQTSVKPDVILNCAPHQTNIKIMGFALEHNIPYCDLGGNPAVVEEQVYFCNEVICRDQLYYPHHHQHISPVVPECGISPGISNILAVHLAKQGYDVIRVRCGGIFDGMAQDNPLNYELLFSPDGLISEYSGKCPIIVNGELIMEDTISCIEPFFHDRLPSDIMSRQIEFESAHTSNNSVEVVEYLQSIGVKHYDYQTIRDLGHWNAVRQWKMLGYCNGDQKKDEEIIEILKNDESLKRRHHDILFLMVKATKSGYLFGEQKELTFMHYGDPNGFSAMEEATSWGITLIAYYMVSGKGKPQGFATPEQFIDGNWMIKQLENRLNEKN